MHRDASPPAVVIKVGGSLFDWSGLGSRLRQFLETLDSTSILIVPGGGSAADLVRFWDKIHDLGQERAHWLAIRALTFQAHFLASLLQPQGRVVSTWSPEGWPILDVLPFMEADDRQPQALPHHWAVTSDSIAARVACRLGARRLILLKSIDGNADQSWTAAAGNGLVDRYFPVVLEEALRNREEPLDVSIVNLRQWTPTGAPAP